MYREDACNDLYIEEVFKSRIARIEGKKTRLCGGFRNLQVFAQGYAQVQYHNSTKVLKKEYLDLIWDCKGVQLYKLAFSPSKLPTIFFPFHDIPVEHARPVQIRENCGVHLKK